MSVATSYAKALYESVKESQVSTGPTNELFDKIEHQLIQLSSLLSASREMSVVMVGPLTSTREKVSCVDAISKKMELFPLLTEFLKLLVRKGRLSQLGPIQEAFTQVRLSLEGGISAQLVTPDPMDSTDLQNLTQAFSARLGKKVAFRVSTDPTLLAGMKVTVNGVTYDGTLRAQLQRLRDRVLAGTASAEN